MLHIIKTRLLIFILLICTTLSNQVLGQENENYSAFDFGRMWTFEDAPLEYFNSTYNLSWDQEWMDKLRQSALRFSTFCSASFVSERGLIMTNHHCSRSVVTDLQQEGEDFDRDGFYARGLMDERKAEGLFVDQLIRAQDVTQKMKALIEEKGQEEAEKALMAAYKEEDSWSDLRLQLVTYYSGGRYAMYGYKRFSDIRLVLIPENSLAFFGGDADNFTYPRYNLDFTFWRAYDDEGNPLNTSAHYFPFNPDGIAEGNPVFVIGNPGRTERYRTMTQLEYDRDVRIPAVLTFIRSSVEVLKAEYEETGDPHIQNRIFSLDNARKAYTGILEGLNNEKYMARKQAAEEDIRSKTASDFTSDNNPWDKLNSIYAKLGNMGAYSTLLNPSPYRGKITGFIHKVYDYMDEETADSTRSKLEAEINEQLPDVFEGQSKYLQALIDDYSKFSSFQSVSADEILTSTFFNNPKKTASWLKSKGKKYDKDPLIQLTKTLMSDYHRNVEFNQKYQAEISQANEKISFAAFKVLGDQLPPDATFTLRISDGVVKPYNYNGTVSPIYTTYFGLYNRYYSHQMEFPWDLPSKWLNPSMDLLRSPLNFVSTNDIIGGNSGSAIINAKGEAVGLIFDGNIESLPGNFIFDETRNRAVSVHAGGIVASLKHIYRADRILKELGL
ncbi:S46 family peptidase [Membranihabitans marinus]|uniref:S46 family peptidase n=1 Tax=Membranihabitans marinus TaxID=1227546 RepID=UPI001F40064A|nr:S46 family peptidase [Membranihabitans marinus]